MFYTVIFSSWRAKIFGFDTEGIMWEVNKVGRNGIGEGFF